MSTSHEILVDIEIVDISNVGEAVGALVHLPVTDLQRPGQASATKVSIHSCLISSTQYSRSSSAPLQSGQDDGDVVGEDDGAEVGAFDNRPHESHRTGQTCRSSLLMLQSVFRTSAHSFGSRSPRHVANVGLAEGEDDGL